MKNYSELRLEKETVARRLKTANRQLKVCSQFKNIYFAEMCSGSEAGSYLRLMDCCITQLLAGD